MEAPYTHNECTIAFSVDDLHDLIKLLEDQPEWRAELRRVLIADELLDVPQILRGLTQAQERAEVRLEQLEVSVGRLAEAQTRTEARVDDLVQAQARTEARVEDLVQAQTRTEQIVRSHSRDLTRLKGSDIERRFRERAHGLLGSALQRTHVLTPDELVSMLDDAEERGALTGSERGEILLTDAVVRGRPSGNQEPRFLVAEVSWGVGLTDVTRAVHRAGLLAKTGVMAIPLVAGEFIAPDARSFAQTVGATFLLMRPEDAEAETAST